MQKILFLSEVVLWTYWNKTVANETNLQTSPAVFKVFNLARFLKVGTNIGATASIVFVRSNQ